MTGMSLLELVFVLSLVATMGATAVAHITVSLSHARAAGAARYLAARLQQVRTDAVARNRHSALRIVLDGGEYTLTGFVDGNGDGVLTRDIQSGADPMTARPVRLQDQFPGVGFGALPGLPAVDPSATPPGDDPVRFGAGNMAVFTPLGTATSGTVYLRGGELQYAVRVFGETGRTRILRFDRQRSQWTPLAGR